MSLKKIIAEHIQNLRNKIAVLDSPSASVAEKGKALAVMVGDDPVFWSHVARNYSHQPVAKRATKPQATILPVPAEPAKPQLVTNPSPASAATMPAEPAIPGQPVTAPARKLNIKSPEEHCNSWVKLLSAFISGKKDINPKDVSQFTASIFKSGVKLVRQQWEVFFAALTKASESGFHIMDCNADPFSVFSVAPTDLTDTYLFGQDGLMIQVLAKYGELSKSPVPRSLVAETWFLTYAVDALDQQLEGGIDDHELFRVRALLSAVEAVKGPEKLIEAIRMIAYGEEDQQQRVVPPATATIGEIIKIKAANDNGSKPDPEEDARHKKLAENARLTASKFVSAIN